MLKLKSSQKLFKPINIVKQWRLESLYLNEFENIGIPDENLYVTNLGGWYNNGKSYSFFFSPKRDSGMDPIIRIIGKSKKISNNPEIWEKDFPTLEKITVDLHKVVNGEIGDLYEKETKSPKYPNIVSYILNPEMEMTHKGIADVSRKLIENVGFKTIGVKSVEYENVIPKDPSNPRNLGFKIPTCCLCPIRITE